MATNTERGPIEEIGDVLTGEAAEAEASVGYEPVPEGDMMNEAQGPLDHYHTPVEVQTDGQPRRPITRDDDDWEPDRENEGDYDFIPGDPVTNDLTDADPDARPSAEAETQPDIGRVD